MDRRIVLPGSIVEGRVLVVGAGLAGLTAAISAREAGASVTIVEKGAPDDVGGNAAFSGGLFLFSYDGPEDLTSITTDKVPQLQADEIEAPAYSADAYVADLAEMSSGRADEGLCRVLAEESLDTMRWLSACGVRFEFGLFGAYVRDGVLHVPPGQAFQGAGEESPGLSVVRPLVRRAAELGIEIRYSTALEELITEDGRVTGAVVRDGDGGRESLEASAVILASGGYQGSEELRRRHLGPEWANVTLRGTRHSTGDGIEAALEIGAGSAGDWARCHSAAVDRNVPSPQRNTDPSPQNLHGFWLGIMVNTEGRRFVNEGPGAWIKNYSKMGKAIMPQPGSKGFEIFDQQTAARAAQHHVGVEAVTADTIRELAEKLEIPADALEETVREFNDASREGTFDMDLIDGKSTVGIDPPKSNWALPLEQPPFVAYRAVTGLTFTLAGLRIDTGGRVLDESGSPIAGLYGAGECTGGLFFADYPGGSGLMRSSLQGRIAGREAAAEALAS
jgi:tricarballylate dehydrogenase